ncbi:BspA family leucine-rich repeat surface protein [Bombilactobacillus mellifer]
MNQKKSIALTTTFVGLVCGFVLTQQQAAAAATNAQDPTTTSMVAPRSTATAKPAEPNQNEQPVNQQTSTQKSITTTDTVNETVNQDQTSRTQSTVSPATNTSTELTNSSNNQATSAQPQQETATQNTAAHSSTNSANEATNQVSQPTAPATLQATKATNSSNTASTTTDPQVETIAQGTWGTSKWEYTHQGDDYILHFHAGTLGASSHGYNYDNNEVGSIGASHDIFNGNWQWSDALTQIIIDPGVKANQNASYLFAGLKHLQQIVGLDNLDTNSVNNMAQMFAYCSKLTSLDLSNFNTTNVTDMNGMFWGCNNLTNLDVSNFNTANVNNMANMFEYDSGLTKLDLSNFNTAKVTNMREMFADCSGLAKLDLDHFNTANVTDMGQMFWGCNNLTNLDVSNFNTANVNNMVEMFEYDSSLTNLDLSNFNTAKVTDMSHMFAGCSGLTSLDLGKFDTSNLSDLEGMFSYCNNLNHLILGSNMLLNVYTGLPNVPETGTQIPGTNRVVASPYWVATSGYQQGHKYTSTELMELIGRDQVTTYDWDSKPAFTQTTETKTKVRTINLHQPNGQLKTETQTVAVSRPVTINPDGSKTYGAWTTAQWDQYTVPEWAGYQASQKQVPATTVSGDSANTTIDIYYQPLLQNVEIQYLDQGKVVSTQTITGYTGQTLMPNYQAPQGYEIVAAAPATITIDATGHQIIQVQVAHKINNSTEFNALTRTVNIHRPDGTMKTYIQTAVLKRNVYIDGVTGVKTYGAWSTDNWDAIQIPVFAGYTASQDQVAAHQVTGEDSDQTVDVYYTPTNTNWL